MTAESGFVPVNTSSSWSDVDSGISEQVQFLGPAGRRVLAFLHRPRGQATAGVVICSSIYEDFHVNYRPEVLVARDLARRGIAAVRFHYRGTGNSDAVDSGALTFDSMSADVALAHDWLTEETGVQDVAWCGSRVGAIVAAEHALRTPNAPLVLWSPLASGAEFFRGMSRANKLIGVRAQARNRQTTDNAGVAEFGDAESVEMLGNRVRQASYDDLRVRTLPTAGGSRPVLILQLSPGQSLTTANASLAATWAEGGADVETVHVRTRQLWTIPDKWESTDVKPETQQIVEGISRWTESTMRARA